MTKSFITILLLLFVVFIAYTQPEIIENGQPSDSAKLGTVVTSGEGIIFVNAYVSQISVKVKGDIIISARSKDKIKITGETVTPELLSDDDIQKYFPPAAAKKKAVAKPAAKKIGYLIYRGVDGNVTLNDNRFIIKIIGKIETMTIFGIGVANFDGEGKYKVTKEGTTEVIENEWQKTSTEETQYNKKRKQLLLQVAYGDNTKQVKPKAK